MSFHNRLITATSHQQVSCLCLLELSVAFDIIDHSIHHHRHSSWFSITVTALAWFKSYLLYRSFCILLASGSTWSPFYLLVAYLKDEFSAQLFSTCILHPISSLISSQSLNHHLSSDDTQLFISFTTKIFNISVTQHQDTISVINFDDMKYACSKSFVHWIYTYWSSATNIQNN